MSKRGFGVELEHGYAREDRDSYGYHSDAVSTTQRLLTENGMHNTPWYHSAHFDGSGCEISSPILRGKEGFEQLKFVMDLLVDNGARCTAADGMHVHFDTPELDNEDSELNRHNASKLARSWVNNRDSIWRFVEPRRRNSGPCCAYPENRVENPIGGSRYELNFSNAGRAPRYGNPNHRPNVEVRLHHGTLDYDEAAAWIKFMQKFIDGVYTRKHPIRCANDPVVLLNRVRTPKTAREKLVSKVDGGVLVSNINRLYEDEYEEDYLDNYDPDW